MDVPDPDRWANAIVQQYLAEQGFTRALAVLEQESGLRLQHEVERGSQLLQLVFDHMERLAASALDDSDVARRQLEEQLLAGGSAAGPGPCPSRLRASIEGLHPANIIAIDCWPEVQQAVSGSSDGSVRVFDYGSGGGSGSKGSALLRTMQAGSSGVLCLALQHFGSGSSSGGGSAASANSGSSSRIVAAGCMDGSVAVVDASTGVTLARSKPHHKYVVAARWAPDGRHLATASWDCSFAVHRLQRRQQQDASQAAAAAAAAAATTSIATTPAAGSENCAAADDGGTAGGWELVTVYHDQTPAKVNALEFLPPLPSSHASGPGAGGEGDPNGSSSGSGSSGSSFLVAVQGSNYLRQLSISAGSPPSSDSSGSSSDTARGTTLGGGGAGVVREERRVNMNATGDDHVSFSAAHLAVSPCGRLVLVSADNGRLMVYERAGWTQLRSIIGLPTEQFHQFAATWHSSGHYIMAAAAHGGLCIFHVGSARRVATLVAHSKNLRGLAYDAHHNLLLTCSFDKTVKVWEAAPAEEAEAGH